MQANALTGKAEKVAFDFLNLPIGGKLVRTPYYNNKHKRVRGGLRALVGKGKPEEIVEEALIMSMKERVNLNELDQANITKFLVDHNLGIDCSGLAYHILDTESKERGLGSIGPRLSYPLRGGMLGWLSRLIRRRYVENADTLTLAHPTNSHEVAVGDVAPGDMVVLIERGTGERNHTFIVKDVGDKEITLIHSIATPEDGKYNHGVRLEVLSKSGQLLNDLRERYRAGSICLRRLNWF